MTPEEKEMAIENQLSKVKDIEQFYVGITPNFKVDIVETLENYDMVIGNNFDWRILLIEGLPKTDQRHVYLLQSFCIQVVIGLIKNDLIVHQFNPNEIDQNKIEKLSQIREDMIECLVAMNDHLCNFVFQFQFNKPPKLKIEE